MWLYDLSLQDPEREYTDYDDYGNIPKMSKRIQPKKEELKTFQKKPDKSSGRRLPLNSMK